MIDRSVLNLSSFRSFCFHPVAISLFTSIIVITHKESFLQVWKCIGVVTFHLRTMVYLKYSMVAAV